MAWIIVSANGEELDRRELTGPLVLGRSHDCDLAVRDILLSRHHCRIEPAGREWRVVDLKSKNGTRVGWQQVASQVLKDGDHLRMGRTRIEYFTGPFEPATDPKPKIDRIVRPADPHEALSGTVTDFVLLDDEPISRHEIEHHATGERPVPQPRPPDPASYSEPQVESLLEDLASGFWRPEITAASGTSTAHVSAPVGTVVRALPRVPARPANGRDLRRRNGAGDTDLSLQVDDQHQPLPEAELPRKRSRRRRVLTTAGLALIAVVGTAIVGMSLWLLTLAPK